MGFEMHAPALRLLALSCAVAMATNLSQFMCLGRFSATSFQVGSNGPEQSAGALMIVQKWCLLCFAGMTTTCAVVGIGIMQAHSMGQVLDVPYFIHDES